jgi:hypothetical protein
MTTSVVNVCEAALSHPELLSGCNKFVEYVAQHFGYGDAVKGNADQIRGKFSTEAGTKLPFHYIGKKPDLATKFANDGKLVIGGLTKTEMHYIDGRKIEHVATMGHVVIVCGGGPSVRGEITLADGRKQKTRGGYPYCYQGAAQAPYRLPMRTQVDLVFPSVLLNEVVYAYLEIGDR